MTSSNSIIPLHLRPDVAIAGNIALSVDSEGFAQPLVPGANFCGFSFERRNSDDDRRSVPTIFEGVTELVVEGLRSDSNGATVFAVGPSVFTLKPKGKSSAIGKVLKREHDGRATVKFSI